MYDRIFLIRDFYCYSSNKKFIVQNFKQIVSYIGNIMLYKFMIIFYNTLFYHCF